VLGAWGVRGDMKVHPLGPPEVLTSGKTVHLSATPRKIQHSKPHDKVLHLKLAGIDNREHADALRGLYLEVAKADLPEIAEDTYYYYQLIGMRVVTTGGEELGKIDEIRSAGGNDVFVVRDQMREVLIPAVDEIVVEVDVAVGRMVIETVPGLLD